MTAISIPNLWVPKRRLVEVGRCRQCGRVVQKTRDWLRRMTAFLAGETWLDEDGNVLIDEDGNEFVCDDCPCGCDATCVLPADTTTPLLVTFTGLDESRCTQCQTVGGGADHTTIDVLDVNGTYTLPFQSVVSSDYNYQLSATSGSLLGQYTQWLSSSMCTVPSSVGTVQAFSYIVQATVRLVSGNCVLRAIRFRFNEPTIGINQVVFERLNASLSLCDTMTNNFPISCSNKGTWCALGTAIARYDV